METNTAEVRPDGDTIRTEVWAMADEGCQMENNTDMPVLESVAFWFTMNYALRAKALAPTLPAEAEVKLLRTVAQDLAAMQKVHLQTRRVKMAERAEEEKRYEKRIAELREKKAKAEHDALTMEVTLQTAAEATAKKRKISVDQARQELERDPTIVKMHQEVKQVQETIEQRLRYYQSCAVRLD